MTVLRASGIETRYGLESVQQQRRQRAWPSFFGRRGSCVDFLVAALEFLDFDLEQGHLALIHGFMGEAERF